MKKKHVCLASFAFGLSILFPSYTTAGSNGMKHSGEQAFVSAGTDDEKKIVVNGVVTDVHGEPIAGANVFEKTSQAGTVTDFDGKFEIDVPLNSTLTISFISYETQSVVVKNQKQLRIKLAEITNQLENVVVVGYGKASGKDIAGSISSLSEKDFNKGPVSSIAQMIQGKVAGVYISKDGDPNSAGSLVIRGTSTLRTGAQAPLYVIDGVPGAGNVSPEDIVSIDILKDASATAIYGSRAANGVIMITTRQGKGGEQRYTTANAYVSIEQVSKRYEMMNGDEYRKYLTDNGSAVETGWDDGVSTDWQKEIMRTAITQNYYFNTGGTINKTRYDASLNYIDQQGIIKTTGQQKAIIRANIEQPFFNDKLTVGMTLNSVISNHDQLPSPSSVYRSMLTFVPTVLATDANGNYKEDIDRRDRNPIALLNQNSQQATNKTMFGSVRAKWDILPGLAFNTALSYQNYQSNTSTYYSKDSKLAIGKNGQVTFFLTVIFDLTIAIEVGLLIAMFLFMKRVAETTHVSVVKDEIDLSDEGEIHHDEEVLSLPKDVEVYEIDGTFFFGVANKFDGVMKSLSDKPKVRIIRMRKVPFMDSTGLHNLESLLRLSKAEGIQLILSGVNEQVRAVLKKSGFDKKIGTENICSNINEAVEKARDAVKSLQ